MTVRVRPRILAALGPLLLTAACAHRRTTPVGSRPTTDDVHAGHDMTATAPPSAGPARVSTADASLPPDAKSAAARLAASPRHGEWAMVPVAGHDSLRVWVVYPERSTKAPVVVVVHEIFGLTTWVRAVADQLAADGFIAIAPDLLSGKRLPMSPDDFTTRPGGVDSARAIIGTLTDADIVRGIDAAARYGTSLPAATSKWGVTGFCWGGTATFLSAASFPTLSAAVPYYGGVSPARMDLTKARAAVLAFYGEKDARVNATIPVADSALRAAGATFDKVIFPGAGHGFLRQQEGQEGANAAATQQAWPRTIAWFRQHLGG